MVNRKYTYTGLGLLQDSLGVYNYTANSDTGLVYTPSEPSSSEDTVVGTAYHTHHAQEGPDVLWTGVKLNLTHSSSEATPSYQNIISLYGLNDGHIPELVGEKIYTTIDATPTTVNVAFNLLNSACQPGFYKLDETSTGATVRVDLPMRYSGNYEDAYLSRSWLSGWSRRKSVTLTGAHTAGLTDSTTQVTVTYDSDMEADFDDIRFTDSDGTTLLDHYLVTKTDSTSAVFNIRVPYIPATPSTKTLYFYYDTSSPSSGSDGFDTYTFFDDFEDGLYTGRSGLYSDWTPGVGTPAIESSAPISGGYSVKHTGNGSDTYLNLLYRYVGWIYEAGFDFKLTTQGAGAGTPFVWLWLTRYTSNGMIGVWTSYNSGTGKQVLAISKYENSTWTDLSTKDWLTGKLGTSTTYQFRIRDTGTSIQVFVDEVDTLSALYTTSMGVGNVGFGCNMDSAGRWDNIRLVRYGPGPSAGSAGSEVVATNYTATPSTTGSDYLVFSTPSDWIDGQYWTLTTQEYGGSSRNTRAVPLSVGDRFRLGYDAVDKYNTLRVGVETTTTSTPYTVSLNNLEYSYEV